MAQCEYCGKKTIFGVSVSHSRSHVSGRHNRLVKPNLKTMTVSADDHKRRITVCTRCMRTLAKTNKPRQ